MPAGELAPARAAVLAYLDASSQESIDVEQAAAMLAASRRKAAEAPEPARALLALLYDRDVERLGARLLPYVERLGGAPALSPVRSPAPLVPVFLVHGETDNVVPSSQTPRLAEYLRSRGNGHVHWLLTPLLSHADVRRPATIEAWRVIRFWQELLGS